MDAEPMNRLEHPDLELFLKHLRYERNASAHTIDAYEHDLQQLLVALQKNGRLELFPSRIQPAHIRQHLATLAEQGLSRASLERKLAGIRAFFRHMNVCGRLSSNPARSLRPIRKRKPLPTVLYEAETEKLFGVDVSHMEKYSEFLRKRDEAMWEMLYATGCRVSELVGLNLEDVSLREQIARIRGKGKKERLVPFGAKARDAVQTYLEVRRRHPAVAGSEMKRRFF